MKVLTFWVWAFGFAILKHIWENHPKEKFYAYEVNEAITSSIRTNREHPFFFPWHKLPKNVKLLEEYESILWSVDLIIIAVPAQYIKDLIDRIAPRLSSGIVILNLAKWIDIEHNKTISSLLEDSLKNITFEYCVFSGWVFAAELIEWKYLWADLWVTNRKVWNEVKKLLVSHNLDVMVQDHYLYIELYGSFKNIIAIMVWYYQWKWEWLSTISYHIFAFLEELKEVVKLYWWDADNIDFSSYSLWGDLITTCFWDSRNRYLWRLLGSWKSIGDALTILKSENKHSEWYETIKAIHKTIGSRGGFKITKLFYDLMT